LRLQLQLLVLLTLCASAVLAAEPGSERVAIALGAFITDRDTEGRLDSDTLGQGTVINFEDDLGLDSSQTVVRMDGYYRFNPRHSFNFAIYDLSRDATGTIDQTIQFGDEIFDVNATISSEFDLMILKLGYSYSFLLRDSGRLAVTGGLHALSIDTALSEPNTGQFESDDLTAPLPVIGLRGNYLLTPRLVLRGSGELFGIEFDDVDGSLFDFYIGLDYHFHDNFAVGLGYNNVSLDVDAQGSEFSGSLDWEYDGFLLNFLFLLGSVDGS